MPTDSTYTVADLARLTGLNVRTIRYYLAQGLIPASGESGPGAHYGEAHLDRLRLIRLLQQQHLPLAEIRLRLSQLTDAQVGELARAVDEPAPATPRTSALDYVRSVLGAPGQPAEATSATRRAAHASPAMRAAPAPPAPSTPAPSAEPRATSRLLRRFAGVAESRADVAEEAAFPAGDADVDVTADAAAEGEPQSIGRSHWERLSLGPNLELHVRRPLGRLEQKRVERLITIARQVLKEEQP